MTTRRFCAAAEGSLTRKPCAQQCEECGKIEAENERLQTLDWPDDAKLDDPRRGQAKHINERR